MVVVQSCGNFDGERHPVRTLDDYGTAGLVTGLLAVHTALVLLVVLPGEFSVVRPLAVGAFAVLALVALGFGVLRVMTVGRGKGRLLLLTLAGLVVAAGLGLGFGQLFSHWSSTPVFASGELVGYAPSPADGGYDGTNYTPLDVEEEDAPGVPQE